jgi:hypothetical protein
MELRRGTGKVRKGLRISRAIMGIYINVSGASETCGPKYRHSCLDKEQLYLATVLILELLVSILTSLHLHLH